MKYTLDDIESFLLDYRNALVAEPHYVMLNVPVVGRKIYQKAALETQKREFFEREFEKVKNGSEEEQIKFIEQMTPILDDFYANRDNAVRK